MNIKKMIPFLDDEELKILAEKIVSSPSGEFQGVKLKNLVVFLDEDVLDEIMLKEAQNGHEIGYLFPFASDEGLSNLVDEFFKGQKIPNFSSILPYIDDDDVAKIAEKVIESGGEYQGFKINSLLPYLDEDDVDKMFIASLLRHQSDAVKFAPFASDDGIHQAAVLYQEGKITDEIFSDIYPFLDDDDIKMVFKKALNS